jgi:hypothetical protein
MPESSWDQSKFNRTLEQYLQRLRRDAWPRAINKKLFFIARGAMKYTPRATPARIGADLLFQMSRTDPKAPLGYILAAKRAKGALGLTRAMMAKVIPGAILDQGAEGRGQLWQQAVKEEFNTMMGARARSAGFIKVGWLSAMTELRTLTGLSYGGIMGEAGVRLVGRLKSRVDPAKAGEQVGAIAVNLAQAHWDKREGQYTKGEPALERAMDDERANMQQFMDEETAAATAKFNQDQR